MQEKILILDFGSQYTQLIARRVRELNVYCEIYPFNHYPALDASVKGVILSGSPFSVRDEKAPQPDLSSIKGKLPLLGVCYGAQYLAHYFGGEVKASNKREYGRANLSFVDNSCPLFKNISQHSQVWMSHGDTIEVLPSHYTVVASTSDVENAAYRVGGEETFGIQFHPEVYHSTEGTALLKNFVVDICGCKQDWTPDSFIETTVAELKEKIGEDRVILGLSGGVDSTVAAMLLHRAIGKNLTCIFVDNGLLRKNEFSDVLENYKDLPKGLGIYEISGPFFFGSAKTYCETIRNLGVNYEVLIIRMRHVPFVDSTGLKNLRETILQLKNEGTYIVLSGVSEPVKKDLLKGGIGELVGVENIYPKFDLALQAAKEKIEEK